MSDMQQFLATAYCPSSVNECKSAIGQQLAAQMIATVSQQSSWPVSILCKYIGMGMGYDTLL
jgi:hypothetical protein